LRSTRRSSFSRCGRFRARTCRSYLQGLNYNDTLAERRAQEHLGWRASAALTGTPGAAALEVRIVAQDSAPLAGLAVSGALRRPADERGDIPLTFAARAPGVYIAELGTLGAGQWRLRARAENEAGQAFDFERSLTWRSTH
jgi:nitrogen fixation protein FixH